MIERLGLAQLPYCRRETLRHLARRFGAPSVQSPQQLGSARRQDEQRTRRRGRIPLPDLARPLHLDVEQDIPARRQHAVHFRLECAVQLARVLGPLQELARGLPAAELVLGEEKIVLAVPSPGRGGRVVAETENPYRSG